jgi:hypothetical protein
MKKAALSSILIAAVLLAVAVIADAQQPAKVPRIGYLSLAAKASPRDEAFVKQLRELGWVDGQNTVDWEGAGSITNAAWTE